MRYKVGDIVKLRDNLEIDKWYDGVSYSEKIKYYQNKPVTIKQSAATTNIYVIENGTLISDEMIEGLWEECKSSEQVEKYNERTLDAWRYAVESKSEGKYRLIDILNKIANGEFKEGSKVIWGATEFIYKNFILESETGNSLYDYIGKEIGLLAEVELIEPNHSPDVEKMAEPTDNTKIEELEYVLEELQNPTYNESWLMNCIRANRDKLNEVIRKLNKEDNNE